MVTIIAICILILLLCFGDDIIKAWKDNERKKRQHELELQKLKTEEARENRRREELRANESPQTPPT